MKQTNATRSTVTAEVVSSFDWSYEQTDGRLRALYEHGKRSQWNASADIDWSVDVEFGRPLGPAAGRSTFPFGRSGSPEMWDRFRWEFQAWMVSQFLHGEQGAMMATARLVEAVPDTEAKLYASNQVADEARHVEVYSRYLADKLGHAYPINGSLASLLDNIMTESRWDLVYLGMQVIIEGLALAAFRFGAAAFHDPLIAQITHLVARDEARHVSFGMIALDGLYGSLSAAEYRDREEFALEAAELMRRRFLLEEIWDRLGVSRRLGVQYATEDPTMMQFRQVIFGKVFASLRRLGLVTPRVRERLAALALLPRVAS